MRLNRSSVRRRKKKKKNCSVVKNHSVDMEHVRNKHAFIVGTRFRHRVLYLAGGNAYHSSKDSVYARFL